MNEQNKVPLDTLAAEAPLCVCSKCGRKTWAREHLLGAPWKRCLMPLPNGGQCRGVWIPEDAAPTAGALEASELRARIQNLRELLCSVAGVDRIESIDVNDLMSYSRMREEMDTALVTNQKLRDQIQKLLNQQADMLRPRLDELKLNHGVIHTLKPDTQLSDGHYAGCPPDCHVEHQGAKVLKALDQAIRAREL
jgi:hypothetical protein